MRLPLAGIALKLLVLDDPAIARSITQLRAEWKAISGGELKVTEKPLADATGDESIDADAVIFPSALLGSLVEREQLVPVPDSTLVTNELAWSEVFELLQVQEAKWENKTYALPLGSPVFTVMYRADLLNTLGKQPPQNWAEYHALAEAIKAEQGNKLHNATVEPLAPGWSGRVLLARAACYARHRDNYSALFRLETMEPLIAGPPFVRALTELVASSKPDPSTSMSSDPAAAEREVLAGRAAMALTWTSAARANDSLRDSRSPIEEPRHRDKLLPGGPIAFAELPGSKEVYNIGNRSWEVRGLGDATRVPLLSIAGRLAGVSQSSKFPEAAFKLIAWLSGPKWSSRVSAVSPATTLYRNSHLTSAKDWVDASLDATTAVQYGETVQQTLVRQNSLSMPRMPGAAEYMDALDEAVIAAVDGTASPEGALTTAAMNWQAITRRFGLEEQRRAYLRSFGLSP